MTNKTTFIELLKKHDMKELWYIISKHHDLPPIRKEHLYHLYESARKEMLELSANQKPQGMLSCELVLEEPDEKMPEPYFNSLLIQNNEKFAIEFTDWAELLGRAFALRSG